MSGLALTVLCSLAFFVIFAAFLAFRLFPHITLLSELPLNFYLDRVDAARARLLAILPP